MFILDLKKAKNVSLSNLNSMLTSALFLNYG